MKVASVLLQLALCSSGNSNRGQHDCVASTLPIELSPSSPELPSVEVAAFHWSIMYTSLGPVCVKYHNREDCHKVVSGS